MMQSTPVVGTNKIKETVKQCSLPQNNSFNNEHKTLIVTITVAVRSFPSFLKILKEKNELNKSTSLLSHLININDLKPSIVQNQTGLFFEFQVFTYENRGAEFG